MALSRIDTTNMIEDVPQSKLDNNINFRNIIINGGMDLAQRGTSFSASNSSGSIYTLDRFQYIDVDTPDSVYTITQDTDVPSGQGFAKSLKVDVATADATLDASDGTQIEHRVEAQNLQYLNFGNSSAKSLTLSFWVKSNKTGTYVVRLLQPDASSWTANTNTNRAVGQVNLADSTSNEWYITGVQLEAGTTASSFETLPTDINLMRCLRYYETLTTGPQQAFGTGLYYTSTNLYISRQFRVTKRAVPTLDQVTGTDIYSFFRNSGADNFNGISSVSTRTTETFIEMNITSNVSGTAGQAGFFRTGNSATTAFIAFDSEL
jgi:hypothetical protein